LVKRKKRLKKGIESLQEQILLHEQKQRDAESQGKIELVEYYKKEISSKEKDKLKKQLQLDKS
jgi:hypothetical protein